MKIVITGSHGYLVNKLNKLLSCKYDVVNISIRNQVEIPVGTDCVIHIAGLTPDKGVKKEDFKRVNIDKTKEVYEKSIQAGAHKFIYGNL